MVCDLYPTEKIEGAFAFETGVPRPETSKNCCMKQGILLRGSVNLILKDIIKRLRVVNNVDPILFSFRKNLFEKKIYKKDYSFAPFCFLIRIVLLNGFLVNTFLNKLLWYELLL